jgi:methionyl-tRNA formyltransferase
VEARLAPIGARLAREVVARFARGDDMTGTPQDNALATRAPKLKKEDGLIDWPRRAEQVRCQVRAMHPWPTAYTFWHRARQPPVRLIVNRATPAEIGDSGLSPGSVLTGAAQGRLLVAAGAGVVEVIELQSAGKRRMAAAEFLRGRPPLPGDRLGPESP